MLVLSRRPDEKILLPTVPAIFKVISAQTGLVRLGIEAPSHVPILREELARGSRPLLAPAAPVLSVPHPCHASRNRLHNVLLGLTLLRMQLADCDPEVRSTLDGIDEEVQALRRHLTAAPAEPAVPVEASI